MKGRRSASGRPAAARVARRSSGTVWSSRSSRHARRPGRAPRAHRRCSRLPGCGYDAADEQHLEGGPGRRRPGPRCPRPELRCLPRAIRRVPGCCGRRGVPAERGAGPTRLRASGRRVRALRSASFTAWRSRRRCPAVVRFEAKGEPGGRLRRPEPDRRGLPRPGRGRRGRHRARRRERRAGRRGAEAIAGRPPSPASTRSRTPRCATGSRSRPSPSTARSTALVVGVATREPGAALAPFVRPLDGGPRQAGIQGHFHAAVVPYRPLPGGAIELATHGRASVRAGPDRDDPPPARRLAADRRGRREHVHPRGHLVRLPGRRRGVELAMTLLDRIVDGRADPGDPRARGVHQLPDLRLPRYHGRRVVDARGGGRGRPDRPGLFPLGSHRRRDARRRTRRRDRRASCTPGSRSTACSPASSSPPRSIRSTSTSWGGATSPSSTPGRSAPTSAAASPAITGPVESVRATRSRGPVPRRGQPGRGRRCSSPPSPGCSDALPRHEPGNRDASHRRQSPDDPGDRASTWAG